MGMGQYLYIFSGMNIHKSQLFWCSPGVPGFWPIPKSLPFSPRQFDPATGKKIYRDATNSADRWSLVMSRGKSVDPCSPMALGAWSSLAKKVPVAWDVFVLWCPVPLWYWRWLEYWLEYLHNMEYITVNIYFPWWPIIVILISIIHDYEYWRVATFFHGKSWASLEATWLCQPLVSCLCESCTELPMWFLLPEHVEKHVEFPESNGFQWFSMVFIMFLHLLSCHFSEYTE